MLRMPMISASHYFAAALLAKKGAPPVSKQCTTRGVSVMTTMTMTRNIKIRSFSSTNFSSSSSSSSSAAMMKIPTPQGVVSAGNLLLGKVVQTPLLESPLLNEQLQTRLLLKAECLQITGSFKYRGALHRLLTLQQQQQQNDDRSSGGAAGVVAFSSGNFGQALAAAATSLNIPCTIVSPHDAPTIKLERIRQYGATLVLSQPTNPAEQNREVVASALAQDIATTQGLTLLHPFEDIHVVHGQGTTGLELIDQAKQQLLLLDNDDDTSWTLGTIVVPCGGGGLTAGICLAVEARGMQDDIQVMTIEPQGFDDHAQSFALPDRKRTSLAELYPPPPSAADTNNDDTNARRPLPPPVQRSVACDALMAGAPGVTTWEVNATRLSNALASTGDESAAHAMRIAFEHFRVVLEPSGALALAAILDGQIPLEPGRAVVVVASGGNTDLTTFAHLMGCTQPQQQ